MIPQWMVITILSLIVFSWFLIGEKKTFGEKVGTLSLFLALYLFYHALNMEAASDYVAKLEEWLGLVE